MPGRRDERGWEEVAKEGLRTRCCQTGTLILAPLLISSVTEGKSLNPSGFSFHQCSPEAGPVYRPQQTLEAQPQCSFPPTGTGSAESWVVGWLAQTLQRGSHLLWTPVPQDKVIQQRGTSMASTRPAQLKTGRASFVFTLT